MDKVVDNLAEHGLTAIPIVMDVTDRDSILNAKKVIEDAEGVLHILVNNAGQVGPKSNFMEDEGAPERADPETLGMALFNNETHEQWTRLYEIDTFSVFFVTVAFLGLLAKGSPNYSPVVINITSISGITKLSQRHFAYNSSKAATSHLTKMMATEFALKKIPVRVNAIAPGVFPSEMTKLKIDSAEMVNSVSKPVIPVPAGRAGTPQEIAGTVIYLASPAGYYTNGQEIAIDGGYLAVNPSTR